MTDTDASGTEQSEELVYGGVCPVCGDEFTDGFERLSELEGESIENVRICVIDPPEENLFHLPEDQSGDTSESELQREDVRVSTHEGHPSLKAGNAEIVLRTLFEGAPPESTETDWMDDHVWFALDFDEEYFDGLLEITPEFVSAEEEDRDD